MLARRLLSTSTVQLGDVLGRGGEGSVYAVVNDPKHVAKVYATPPARLKQQKLEFMARHASPELAGVAAWPTDLLLGTAGCIGFVMPRVIGRKDIHELYSPKSRSDSFPEVDFRFIVHAGANIARAFATVHRHGHVIGDINHGSIMVGSQATVTLIDCDSFQVGAPPNVYTCDVGVSLFTPAELQGKPFRGLIRDHQHDAFGLAVIVFHLLFMGRHPFAGSYKGRGDMPIERAISEGRFAYGPASASKLMHPPPHTPPLDTHGAAVSNMFRAAFEGAANARPTAAQWADALGYLGDNLRKCAAVSTHYFFNLSSNCPWCAIERATGARLFGQRIEPIATRGVVSIDALWRQIENIPGPPPDPDVPNNSLRPAAPFNLLKAARRTIAIVAALALATQGGGGFLIGLVAGWFLWPRSNSEAVGAAENKLRQALAQYNDILSRWRTQTTVQRFDEAIEDLRRKYGAYRRIPEMRQKKLDDLRRNAESVQRRHYLDRFHIRTARIPNIGPSRKATLLAYGIETAADVEAHRIRMIDGFGPSLTADLLAWRRGHESHFRFNPAQALDPRDIANVEREIALLKQKTEAELAQAPARLTALRNEIVAARERLLPILEKAREAHANAVAEKNAL